MKFSTAALSAFVLAGGATAFTQKSTTAFIHKPVAGSVVEKGSLAPHGTGSLHSVHAIGCGCVACNRSWRTLLLSAVEETVSTELAATASGDIPPEVEALDGINSDEEQHNAERPARKSIKKKGPKGKPLSELKVGDVIRAKAKTIASYGAFMDIGAESDGLLHISQLSVDFVKDVNDVLKVGEEYDVRITKIDAEKKQVALTLLSEAQEEEAAAAAAAAANERQAKREQRTKQQQQTTARRDDSAIVDELQSKGWDPTKFVDGTVVSIVDFGAFVRIDCSQLNPDIQGSMDGLVHISALAKGRVDSVQSIVKIDDQVKVRVKSIDNRKVSLTMVSAEDEASIKEARATSVSSASSGSSEGAKDWKESLKKMQEDLPEFKNRPLIVDNRKS